MKHDEFDYSEEIRKFMKENNLTQADLGRMAGVAQQTVSGWLSKRIPNLKHLEKLGKPLGKEAWEFLVSHETIAKHFKLSPEAFSAAQGIDLLPADQKATVLAMINAALIEAASKKQ